MWLQRGEREIEREEEGQTYRTQDKSRRGECELKGRERTGEQVA